MSSRRRTRGSLVLLAAYALALLHVLVVFTLGEPYPSLQGPLFAGHLQRGDTIRVPFFRDDGDSPELPSRQNLLRHETLALPIQRDSEEFAPAFSSFAARQFLIGHSLRTPALPPPHSDTFPSVRWSTWKFHAPLDAPPTFLGEEDLIRDE